MAASLVVVVFSSLAVSCQSACHDEGTLCSDSFTPVTLIQQNVELHIAKHAQQLRQPATYELMPLPYPFDALEPYINNETMYLHHNKHHQKYVDNLNAEFPDGGPPLLDVLSEALSATDKVRNNAGGIWNHNFFWMEMAPSDSTGQPSSELSGAIDAAFGNFSNFQAEFADAASTRFGSGWAWLIVDSDGDLVVTSTPNQDNPLMVGIESEGIPVMGIDVWEHAYYLGYRNVRDDYIEAWWSVVNWNQVNQWYADAVSGLPPDVLLQETDVQYRRSANGRSQSAKARIAKQEGGYQLPPLPYAYDALSPYIDQETMELHHDAHHDKYITKLNEALEGQTAPFLRIFQCATMMEDPTIRNNGGGAYNHQLFWQEMSPQQSAPSDTLSDALDDAFGSFSAFQAEFNSSAAGVFGSGWAWLIVTSDGGLEVTTTANQDNPLMVGIESPGIPILGIDV